MRIDVIVSTYNRAGLLAEALESLTRQELGAGEAPAALEIVVVDNASTDGTRAVVESLAARAPIPVRYCHESARGVAHARRRGVLEARGEWLAFFDDDQLAEPGWLRELAAAARESGARCVGGRVTLAIDGAVAPPLPAFCRTLLGETPGAARAGPYAGKQLPGTGNVLLHRSVLDAVGSFDPALEQGAEDTELFRRVRRAGIAMWYAPRARVSHRTPPYRTTREYLLWVARRHGAASATIDLKEGGRRRVVRNALLRAAQALVVTGPRLLGAWLARAAAARLEARCRLSRAAGYLRQALRLVAPRAFAQPRFFGGLEFRQERARFA